MEKRTINKLIGFGILIFSLGFFLGLHWIKLLQLLMPFGSVLTFTGVFYFFKETNLAVEFTKDPKDDVLTFFWNVVVLKFWTFVFVVWMIFMNISLMINGLT
jgi:hypothetical protein